eukprot:2656157-Rhodomonas_salina.1
MPLSAYLRPSESEHGVCMRVRVRAGVGRACAGCVGCGVWSVAAMERQAGHVGKMLRELVRKSASLPAQDVKVSA